MEPRELKTDNVILRIEPSKKVEWTKAAANSGMNLSRYISSCVDGKIKSMDEREKSD